jgi:periplasmic protein TonB
MAAATYRNGSWRRLPWLLPAALLLSLLALIAFMALLTGPAYRPAPATPVEVQLVELPPAPAAPPAVTPPPPAVAEPEPPPPPPPPLVQPEPELPPPLPQAAAQPPPKPPPPPRPRVARPERPPPSPAPPSLVAPAAPATPAPAPAPVETGPPRAATMGARVIFKPPLELPPELRRQALDLVVVVRLHIAADGSVQAADLTAPTADPILNQWLIAYFRRFRFFPAIADGKPVASDIPFSQPLSVK